MDIRFEWDSVKAEANVRKHSVSFELVSEVFLDPFHLSEQDRIEGGEYRWRTTGMVRGQSLLVVAHVVHDDVGEEVIRIISARHATRVERKRYEQDG
jgi:uncharacterized DUF497 family protein